MRLRTILTRCVLLAVLLLGAGSAFAEEPVEVALAGWLSAIDASPDWRVQYAALTADPATAGATLDGLMIASERPGMVLRADALTVSGYRATDGDTFAARQIDVSGATLAAGFLTVSVPKARLSAVVLPMTGGGAWDDSKPALSLLRLLAPLAGARAASVLADSIELTETVGTVESRTSYGQVRLTNWSDGTIALLQSGPLYSATPANDPLVSLSVQSSESRNVDLRALLHALDPAAYGGNAADGAWRRALDSAAYHTISIDLPGVSLSMAEAGVSGFQVRQTAAPPDWSASRPATSDDGMSPDALLATLDRLAAYRLGGFTLHDINVTATGLDRIHLGDLSLKDLSLEGIGEIAMADGAAVLSEHGSVKFGRLALGGLVPPTTAALRTALQAAHTRGDIDLSAIVPQLGFVEADDLAVDVTDGPRVGIHRYRLDLKDYVDAVPTTIALAVEGADIPASLVPLPRVSTFLDRFGYDRVNLDAAADITWRGDTITIPRYRFAMKDLAAVSGQATLRGLSPADAAKVRSIDEALRKLSFTGGTFTFEDDSIIGRSLDEQAKRLNTDPVKFRQQFVTGLPFMLTFLGNPDLQRQLAPVLQSLIRSSGSLTATASPASPVLLATALAAARTAPFGLLAELGLTFSGTTGPEPEKEPTPTATPAE